MCMYDVVYLVAIKIRSIHTFALGFFFYSIKFGRYVFDFKITNTLHGILSKIIQGLVF